jgi:hemoglobin
MIVSRRQFRSRSKTMNDIESRTDIDLVMRVFYEHAFVDDTIGHIFTDVALWDIEKHLPVIGDFWDHVLFGESACSNRGRDPLEVHRLLDRKYRLTEDHFRRWLDLFCHSVDSEFRGPRAEFLKGRARAIARRMQMHLIEARFPVTTASTVRR